MNYKTLILSPFYSPNIGGVESHLDDLTRVLIKKKISTLILTLAPVTTKNTSFILNENIDCVKIIRFPWKANHFYHFTEKLPILNFIYLFPYFFLKISTYLLRNKIKVKNIHCQGFISALIGLIINYKLKSNLLLSTHALYNNNQSIYLKILFKFIIMKFDKVLCVSNKSKDQLVKMSNSLKKRVFVYKYWIDTNKFGESNINFNNSNLSITFIGRLIKKKGIDLILDVSSYFPNVVFNIIGTGPEEEKVKDFSRKNQNIIYHGYIPNNFLNSIYKKSNFVCFPSLYPEGFGRVMLESLSCGTPIIATKLGSITEAVDENTTIFIDPNIESLKKTIDKIIQMKKSDYLKLRKSCRSYALKNFSEHNSKLILNHYIN